jgi:hypothetical protein
MKKLSFIFIIILGIIFISGCIGGLKSITEPPSKTPTASSINQKSDVKTSQLIPNPDDVPGYTLKYHYFYAIPQNSSYVRDSDSFNETRYENVLPVGYRNVGQASGWSNNNGSIDVIISRYDSKSGIREFINASYYNMGCPPMKNNTKEEDFNYSGCGSPEIGDYSLYIYIDSYERSKSTLSSISFGYENYLVVVVAIDEKGKSENETIQFAKIIRSRLG